MKNIDSLVTMMKRIFPNEECTHDNVGEYMNRLALKVPQQEEDHFITIQPQQISQSDQYVSEKITSNPLAKDKLPEPYARFKKMKKLAGYQTQYINYYSEDPDTFYKQALFMKDFTDNYSKTAYLDTYYTTYAKMNDDQLRTYFTWRTKVRQGIIDNTSSSYAFCYISELLNDIGVDNPADAIDKLLTLWIQFRQYDVKIDNNMCKWLRDYYVAHKTHLPNEFSQYSRRFPVPYRPEAELWTKVKSCSWDDLHVIEASSSFKITNGQFYKAGNQEMIEKCTCFTIQALAKIFENADVDFRKIFFEKRKMKIYNLYQGAVAVDTDIINNPMTVEIDAFETMKHNYRNWSREYISITQYRPVIGYILKLVEVHMRRHFGYKRNLQAPNISAVKNSFLNSEPEMFSWPEPPTLEDVEEWKGKAYAVIRSESFEKAIINAISDYCKESHIVIQGREIRVIKPIEIDLSKLKEIERDHIETAKKLIIEEPQTTPLDLPAFVPVPDTTDSETKGMIGLADSLPTASRNLLTSILEGGQAPPNSELLIETINEKALEAIDDNLIDYAEGVPYIYEDYIDELKSSLGGHK